jgi:hypothetical protein
MAGIQKSPNPHKKPVLQANLYPWPTRIHRPTAVLLAHQQLQIGEPYIHQPMKEGRMLVNDRFTKGNRRVA